MLANVCIVGATGLVGTEVLTLLEERRFPYASLALRASERSAGGSVEVGGEEVEILELAAGFGDADIVFLCAPAAVCGPIAREVKAAGGVAIDTSGACRSDGSALLIELERNGPDLAASIAHGGIASLAHPLARMIDLPFAALEESLRPTSVRAVAFRAVSARGRDGIAALSAQTASMLGGAAPDDEDGPAIAFDCRPTDEGDRVLADLRALGLDLPISVSTVSVPVFFGDGLQLTITSKGSPTLESILESLRETPSLLLDDDDDEVGDKPSTREAVGLDAVRVARVRVDEAGVHMWLTADAVRQGAALHAVALAEMVLRRRGAH